MMGGIYGISKDRLEGLFSALAAERELYLPVLSGGKVNFSVWEEGADVRLDVTKTAKSPKDAFFPQFETLYTCRTEEGKLKIDPEELCRREFVVFGMRACDAAGLRVLDRVFLSEPVDTFYAARRELGTIVSIACGEPEESCFCRAFGIDAAAPDADAAAWFSGERLLMKPQTEKGMRLVSSLSEYLTEEDGAEAVIEEEQAKIRAITEKLPYSSLSLEGWGSGETKRKFDSPLWEKLYRPCLACGTCTFVCPTCQCYDIKDYKTKNGVQRYRCWDSCMYSDFTLMAGGNNRTTQLQRFRQRFMHKLVYFPENNEGMFSCVGCGRCVDSCPSSLNIVKVIKAFGKDGGDE